MKKWIVMLMVGVILTGGSALAVPRGTPEYEQLKEYKRKQHAEREQKKVQENSGQAPKEKNFWQREAERSGFAGTGAMFSNALANAVPLDKPNSRKTSS